MAESQVDKKPSRARLRLRVAAIVFAALCALVVIATFGRGDPLNPFSPIQLNAPSVADHNSKHTAIVDSESRRVLILNKNDKLTGIISCDALNSPLEAVTDVCVAGDLIYVAGVQYETDSTVIVRERVVAYDSRGRSSTIVFDKEVENENTPSIRTMDSVGDDVYFVMVTDSEKQLPNDQTGSDIKVYRINGGNCEEVVNETIDLPGVYDIGYSARSSYYATISERGVFNDTYGFNTRAAGQSIKRVDASEKTVADAAQQAEEGQETPYLGERMFTSLDNTDDGTVVLYDDSTGSVCILGNDGELKTTVKLEEYGSVHINENYIAMSCRTKNAVSYMELSATEPVTITDVQLGPMLTTMACVVLVCRVYLAAYIIVAIVRKVRSLLATGNTEGVGPLFASIAVVSVVMLAIGYLSYGSYQTTRQTREREISVFADYLDTMSTELSESMMACSDRNVYRKNNETLLDAYYSMLQIEAKVGGLVNAATSNGVGTYAIVYGRDNKGVFYLGDSTNEHIMGSTADGKSKEEVEKVFESNDAGTEIHRGTTLRDATQYRLVRIPTTESDSTAGVIEIGSRIRSFESSIMRDLAQRILAALVMVLVVYLSYVELRACARCFISYTELKHHHDAIAVLTRPFSFFITMLSSIDSVMTALIARALIGSAGVESNAALLALPAVMLGVGLAAGQAIYSYYGSRVLIQRLMRRGAIFMVIAAIFAAVVVWFGNFWLYCLAKLLMAIPFGLLYTLTYSLPRRADTDEVRELAAGGIKRTDTSAAALGTVLGGYAAQALGNAWVYVLVAVVGVIVVVLATRVLPRTEHPLEHKARSVKSHREALIKLLTSKTTIPIILFIMLPAILASGYNSFIFPLFSANLGLKTSAINNLFVLGQLVVFVCIPVIERAEGRYDKWRVSGTAIALMAVVFLLFSFNTTLAWAVVTIALVGVLCKSSDGWKALWPRSAKANGLTTGYAMGIMFAVRSVLLIVQPLILGALLMAGDKVPPIALGIVCAVCAVAFFASTRNSALAPHDHLSLEQELMYDDELK